MFVSFLLFWKVEEKKEKRKRKRERKRKRRDRKKIKKRKKRKEKEAFLESPKIKYAMIRSNLYECLWKYNPKRKKKNSEFDA